MTNKTGKILGGCGLLLLSLLLLIVMWYLFLIPCFIKGIINITHALQAVHIDANMLAWGIIRALLGAILVISSTTGAVVCAVTGVGILIA